MCYAAAALIISAVSAVATYATQDQQARSQARFQTANSMAEADRSKTEMLQIRQKQAVDTEARSLELAKVSKEAKKQRSTAVTTAGEANVSGNSVDALINDYAAQEAAIYSQTRRQAELDNLFTEQQLAASRAGSVANQARINAPINRPSALAAALSIGSGYLDSSQIAEKRGGWLK